MVILEKVMHRAALAIRDRSLRKELGTCVSFPKSGRTWLRVMLTKLDVHLAYDHDGSDHLSALQMSEMRPCAGEYPGRRHLFLFRDPRDTVVSGYFQASKRLRSGYQGSMAEFIRDPRHGIEKVITFNAAWLRHATGKPQFSIISYELLREHPVFGLERILEHLNPRIPRNSRRILDVVQECRFERMQEQEKQGVLAEQFGPMLRPAKTEDPESYKVRRGKVGGYTDYLDDQDQAYCEELMQRTGYQDLVDKHTSTQRVQAP